MYLYFQHDLDDEATDIPMSIRCSAERLSDDGVYLLGKFDKMTNLNHSVPFDIERHFKSNQSNINFILYTGSWEGITF